jgi:DNA-binding transcriptional ArsR family regulator
MSSNEKELERVLKAMANKRRLAMLKHIKKTKEAAVGEIASAIKLSFKATSRHLALLASADVLEREQRNIYMFYRLAANLPESAKMIVSLL